MAPSHLVYAHLDRMRTQLNEMDMAYGQHMDAYGTWMHMVNQRKPHCTILCKTGISESPAPGVGLTRVEMHGMHGMG